MRELLQSLECMFRIREDPAAERQLGAHIGTHGGLPWRAPLLRKLCVDHSYILHPDTVDGA